MTAWLRAHPAGALLLPVGLFLTAFFVGPLTAVLRVSLAADPGGTGYGDGTPFYVPCSPAGRSEAVRSRRSTATSGAWPSTSRPAAGAQPPRA